MNQSTDKAGRATRRRSLMLELLVQAGRPLSAQELYEICLPHMRLSPSTVYRALSALAARGVLERALRPDGTACYQPVRALHSHSLVCSRCHRVVPIDGCPLQQMARRLERETGFVVTGHWLQFIGLCPECAQK